MLPLVAFELWPIDQVEPWRADDGPYLRWFGLTDGWYCINAGDTELTRIDQAIIDATPQSNWRTPYFDYNVARPYEDLLDILPAVIEPIPSDLVDLIRDRDAEDLFMARSEAWADEHWPSLPYPGPATTEQMEQFNACSAFWRNAAGWWPESRFLLRGHLQGQPEIALWREGDHVHIRWTNDCEDDPQTGLPWNSVEDGEWSLPFGRFIDEVESLHTRLMAAMARRISLLDQHGPPAGVRIDMDMLRSDHHIRERSLAESLERGRERATDWMAVRAAVREVEEMMR